MAHANTPPPQDGFTDEDRALVISQIRLGRIHEARLVMSQAAGRSFNAASAAVHNTEANLRQKRFINLA